MSHPRARCPPFHSRGKTCLHHWQERLRKDDAHAHTRKGAAAALRSQGGVHAAELRGATAARKDACGISVRRQQTEHLHDAHLPGKHEIHRGRDDTPDAGTIRRTEGKDHAALPRHFRLRRAPARRAEPQFLAAVQPGHTAHARRLPGRDHQRVPRPQIYRRGLRPDI